MRGYLGETLIADLIRDIACQRLSGSLRLSRDKIIKAIFFDAGSPVLAISNLQSEQIEHKLIKDRIVTAGLVEAARKRNDHQQRLGQTLVEMGAIRNEAFEKAAQSLTEQIIKSLFEWEQGEYAFDETARADHAARLQWSAADCILEGARHAAGFDSIAARILPARKLIAPAMARDGSISHAANLNSSEGCALSCVQSPMTLSELSAVAGLSEPDARRAVCALVSLGALMMVESGSEISVSANNQNANSQRPDQSSEARRTIQQSAAASSEENDDDPARWIIEEVTRKLDKIASSDHYETLGVDRLATTTTIRQAFYDLEMMFNSFRARWPAHQELNKKLDALFAKVNHAYYTLSDLNKRRAYDMPSGKQSSAAPQIERGQAETARRAPSSIPAQNKTQAINPPPAQPVATQTKRPVETNLKKVASEKYLQGRSLYEKRDFHTAAHLLREAVKLDSSRPEYHYYLALVLSVLSQARHMHDGHEGCHVTCNLGGSLIRNQRVRYEALQHFQEAARLEPANAQIRVKLGMLYKDAGMAKKAEACFWEALLLDGNNQAALMELGLEDKADSAKPETKKDLKKKIS